MVGELTGYSPSNQANPVKPVVKKVGSAAFESVLAPPPSPDLTYEGVVPAPVQPVHESAGTAEPGPVREDSTAVVVRRTPSRPVQTGTACPGEWEDTWLWELCREHERGPA